MPHPRRPVTPITSFLNLLWRQPLYAIPFAFFFGTVFGRGNAESVWLAYRMSVVFSYSIGLALWVTRFVAFPLLERHAPPPPNRATLYGAIGYTLASVVASYAAGLVVHFTILPGFFGSVRAVMVSGMFTLLFAVLFAGVNMAIHYYKASLDKVRAEQELLLARRIQRSFLLSQFPAFPRLEVYAVNLSSKEVSGDFYDVVPDADGSYLLAVADVSGKGVPAALLTSMLQASLRTQAGAPGSVAEILRTINRLAYRSTPVNQFATFFLARVHAETLEMVASNAGHNYPVVFRADGRQELLTRGGVVVGILEDATYEEERLVLAPGDRVVLYSDGVTEAANSAGEMFGEDRLYALVAGLPASLTAEELTTAIVREVHAFLDGIDAGDDITVMALRVREPEPAAVPAGA